MNKITDPALTYTLEDFINFGVNDEMTYRNFSILEVIDGKEFVDRNIIQDYLGELESICQRVELTDEQYKEYKYAPDLLAYRVYGSTQLDFIVMYVNGIIDPAEFNMRILKLPYASHLKTFLNLVYNAEQVYIQRNRADNGLVTT